MSGISKANQRQNSRRKPMYTAYKHSDTREKNKAYKLLKHLERHPGDKTSLSALDNIPDFCVRHARKRLTQNKTT